MIDYDDFCELAAQGRAIPDLNEFLEIQGVDPEALATIAVAWTIANGPNDLGGAFIGGFWFGLLASLRKCEKEFGLA